MILVKSDEVGMIVSIEGSMLDVAEEITNMLHSLRDTLIDKVGEEYANMVVAYCGRMAFAKSEDDMEEATNEFKDFLRRHKVKEEVI